MAGTTQAHVGGPTVVLAYGYNDAGLRTTTTATIDGVADYVDEYAYDSEGRLVAIAQYGAAGGSAVADKQITLTYNDQGLLATVARYTDGNLAVLAQYTYDSASRLTALVYSQGETILASYAWTYSADGSSLLTSSFSLPTSFSWLPSGGLMPGQDTGAIVDALWEGTGTPASLITEITSLDGTVSYSYDSAGQLLGATYTTGQAAEAYSYDAAGNRVTANGAAYLTGPNNQLLFDGVFSYSYDPEGNRTARFIDVNANGLLDAGDTAATTYAWDHRNRLTCVTDYDLYGDPATRAVDYLYDLENRWIGRDVDLDADGIIDTRTRFAYDGNQIALQFDRALAPTGDPADPLTLENLSHRYLWNPAAVDQLMADEHVTTPDTPGTILWPLADHLGTIRDLAAYDSATATTTVVNHRTFDAYGNLQSQTSTAPAHDTLFAFTGRPLDQETSLQNNLHRWYDPAVGRWMSEDPVGFEGKDGNLYAYVGNGPVNATDPSGTCAPPPSRTPVLHFPNRIWSVKAEDRTLIYSSPAMEVGSGTFQIRICHASSEGYANVNIRFTPKTGGAVEIDIDADSIRMIQIARATNTGGQWQIDGAGEDHRSNIILTPYWKNNQYPGEWLFDGRLREVPPTGKDNQSRTAWMLDSAPGTTHPWLRLEAVTLVVATDGEGNDLPVAYIRWVYCRGDSHYLYVIEAGEGEPIVDGMRFFDIVRKQLPKYNPGF